MTKIRVSPTGTTSEVWRVECDGKHLTDVHLIIIHATGRGEYIITGPDRPGEVWAPFIRKGAFTFDVWDQATVRDRLRDIIRLVAPDDDLDITITKPTR
jgi:hypothetical protein